VEELLQNILKMNLKNMDYSHFLMENLFRNFFLKTSNSYGGYNNNGYNKGRNIVGLIPAKKKFANNIIICAHYDHIGKIKGKIYPGADDNASGVTALLELAKAFGFNYKENGGSEYNFIFVAFDGNNYSLSGSKYFLEKFFGGNIISCVINIDQIGSTLSPPNNRKDYLLVLGSDHLTPWQKRQIDYVNKFFKINLDIDYSYYNSKEFYDIFYRLSDHYPFFTKGIPSVLFSSGITKHTNKESDSIQNLDIAILNKRINLIYRFLWQIN
jgi:Predicted aminopeptidases